MNNRKHDRMELIEDICFIVGCLTMAALLIWVVVCGVASAETASAATATAVDLTGIFNAVIALLGALVTYRLIPWIKARTTQSQQESLTACAKTLVYAAEQLYRTGAIQDRLSWVQSALEARGYAVDRAAIEAAVTQLRSDNCAYLTEMCEEAIPHEDASSAADANAQVSQDAAQEEGAENDVALPEANGGSAEDGAADDKADEEVW